MSAKPLRPYSEVELVPGQPGQTPLLISYSLSVGHLPALRQKRGVGSRRRHHTLQKRHARNRLLQQSSPTQRLCVSYRKSLKIPLVKCASQPHQWLVHASKYCSSAVALNFPVLPKTCGQSSTVPHGTTSEIILTPHLFCKKKEEIIQRRLY